MFRAQGRTRALAAGWRGWISAVITALLLSGSFVNSGFAQVTNLSLGQSINLSRLLGPGGLFVQVGDKLFSAFTFTKSGDFPTSFDADDINVIGIQDPLGNLGIRLQGGISPILGGSGDVFLTYSVSVTSPDFLISDLHLEYNGSAESLVTEQAFVSGNPIPVAHLEVSNPPTNFFASANILSPTTQLQIQKDIFIRSTGGVAVISNIDQTFSQIPEPSTITLTVACLVPLLLVKRRKLS